MFLEPHVTVPQLPRAPRAYTRFFIVLFYVSLSVFLVSPLTNSYFSPGYSEVCNILKHTHIKRNLMQGNVMQQSLGNSASFNVKFITSVLSLYELLEQGVQLSEHVLPAFCHIKFQASVLSTIIYLYLPCFFPHVRTLHLTCVLTCPVIVPWVLNL